MGRAAFLREAPTSPPDMGEAPMVSRPAIPPSEEEILNERDGCECCVHVLRCAHFGTKVLLLSEQRGAPGHYNVGLCNIDRAEDCDAGGKTYYVEQYIAETEATSAGLAAFHAAEERLLQAAW